MKVGLVIALVVACWAARGQQVLDTATVKARRLIITPRIDGFSFDARQTRPAAGETATDLLSRLPGVQIDQQGSPIIRGSGQIKLFIDGRPAESYASTVAEALRLISADNIARVEVITHPSARYDAEGVDAVINIFTKKQLTDGVSGSANAQIANRTTEYQVRAAWRKHHWMVNTEGGRYAYHYNSYSLLNRADPGAHLLQTQDYDERNHNEYASTTVTWTPDSLITLNLGYRYSQGHGRSLTNLDNAFSEGDSSLGAYSTFTNSINQRRLHTLNWGLFGSTRNRSMEYELMATWFGQTRATNYTQTGNGPVQTSHNDIDNRELAVQGDLTKKLGPQTTVETGVKSTFRQFHNQNLLSPDSTRSNRFFFRRSIIAFFLSYTVDLGQWKIRLGGRYEQTHWPLHFADTALTPPDYKNFIPDLTLSYIPAPGHTLSAGYSRKLIRPYIDNLNPVVNYLDSLNITYGNPALRPAYSNNYELNYNYRKSAWLLTTTLFLRRASQSIENIRLLQSGGVVASTYANIAKNSILGLTANFFYQPDKFTLNWSNTLARVSFNSPGYAQNSGFEFSTGIDVSYKATPTLSFSGSGYFNTPHFNLQGSRGGWRNYSVMVNKDIPNTRLGFSFRVESFLAGYQYINEEISTKTFHQTTLNRYVNRSFRFGATWKFGKKDMKTLTSRTITVDN